MSQSKLESGGLFEFHRGQKAQGLAWAQGIIVVHPLGEYFAAKRAVVALHIGILGGFARLNPVQDDVLGFAPVTQCGADELGPVIAAQLLRPAVLLDQLGQQAHHTGRWQGEVHFDAEHLAVEIIDDVERAESPAVGQRVAGKVQ